MSTYTCRLYKNTGFDTINIPDSPARLDACSYTDFPSLDINQDRFLPEIRIRATWDQVKDADYAKVGDFFYSIDASMIMTSGDVCTIPLIPDYVTSAGGPKALQFNDGLTERVHVADDTYGLYGEADPYTAPAYDMDIESMTHNFTATAYSFVETTIDLAILGFQKEHDSVPAQTAKDPFDSNLVVTYPVVPSLAGMTNYSMAGFGNAALVSVAGQGVYRLIDGNDATSETLRAGIAQARSLGVEESISGLYSIPTAFVSGSNLSSSGFQSGLTGQTGSQAATGMSYIYGTANNKRVFYGEYSPYTLASASGETITAKAEEVYDGGSVPTIMYVADPRRTGKPYYRFKKLNGKDASVSNLDFFRGCVAGNQWQSQPLVMKEKSGSAIDRINYNASRRVREIADEYAKQGNFASLANAAGGLLTSTFGAAAAGTGKEALTATQTAMGVASAANSGLASLGNAYLASSAYMALSNAQKAIEIKQLGITTEVAVPTIMFPSDPALFSEITGNGFSVYRTVYKQADITRIDKILTAYGYKFTKLLETSDFTNRTYFNYVRANVGGCKKYNATSGNYDNIPKWWSNGIALQLSNGVRVWHVDVNPAYYTTGNPIVTTP